MWVADVVDVINLAPPSPCGRIPHGNPGLGEGEITPS